MPIKVLDKNVAELIAAGEVIERPSSVIKELVENAIDAGASRVTVEISGGGVAYMRITDDGCGIKHDEVPVAFLRHATSKVKTENDLESITTMGFRGEALASISAVAEIEMLTKRADDDLGTLYKISGGEEIEHGAAGCPDGTTIIIRNLFYNTPARLKFLKKDVSEGNSVQSTVEKLALINPGISFRFIRDNKPILTTPGDGELISSIYSVFGKQFACSLIAVDYEQSGIAVKGYVSSPLFCRGNRTMQYFFVNSRYVKSMQCTAALEEGYRNSIMTGKFPAAVLNITLNPADVDVNVHPAKTEVRFSDDRSIFNAVYFAVKNAILNADNIKEIEPRIFQKTQEAQAPASNIFRSPSAKNETVLKSSFTEYTAGISHSANKTVFGQRTVIDEDFGGETATFVYINEEAINGAKAKAAEAVITEKIAEKAPLRIIGELWASYIVCEAPDGDNLILIDKHAAHERLRFNALKQEFVNTSQLLAESIFVTADSEICGLVIENREILLDLGIEVLKGENNTLEITAVPSVLAGEDMDGILSEITGILKNGGDMPREVLFDDLLHGIACKSAIKAHDKSDLGDLGQLANAVYADESVRFCPHGRPIIISLSRREIEKNFGRI